MIPRGLIWCLLASASAGFMKADPEVAKSEAAAPRVEALSVDSNMRRDVLQSDRTPELPHSAPSFGVSLKEALEKRGAATPSRLTQEGESSAEPSRKLRSDIVQSVLQKRVAAGESLLQQDSGSSMERTMQTKNPIQKHREPPQDKAIDMMIAGLRENYDHADEVNMDITYNKEPAIAKQMNYANWQIKKIYRTLVGEKARGKKKAKLGNKGEWKLDKTWFFAWIKNMSADIQHTVIASVKNSSDIDNEISAFFKHMRDVQFKQLGWDIEKMTNAPLPPLENKSGVLQRNASRLGYKIDSEFSKFDRDRAETTDEVTMRKELMRTMVENRLMDIGTQSQDTLSTVKEYLKSPSNEVTVAKQKQKELKKELPKFKKFTDDGPKKVSKKFHKNVGYIQQRMLDAEDLNNLEWELIWDDLKADSNEAIETKIEDLRLMMLDAQSWGNQLNSDMSQMQHETGEESKELFNNWQENVTKDVKTVGEVQNYWENYREEEEAEMEHEEELVKEEGEHIRQEEKKIEKKWNNEKTTLTNEFDQESTLSRMAMVEENKVLSSASRELKARLVKNLEALDANATMNLGALENKVGDLEGVVIESYDASRDWMEGAEGLLDELGDEVTEFEGDSKALLGDLDAETNAEANAAAAEVGQFGGELMSAIEGMGDEFEANQVRLKAEGEESMKESEQLYEVMMAGEEKQAESKLAGVAGNLNAFRSVLGRNEKDLSAKNGATTTKIQGDASKVAGVGRDLDAEQDEMFAALHKYNGAVVQSQADFNSELRDEVGGARASSERDLEEAQRREEDELAAWKTTVAGHLEGKEGEMSELEASLRRSMEGVETKEQGLSRAVRDLDAKARSMRREVSKSFGDVQQHLKGEQLHAAQNEKELREALRQRGADLKRVSAQTLSKLGAAHKESFDAIQAAHEEKVNAVMNDNTKTLKEKQAAIAELDRDAAKEFAALEEEATINEDDVAKIRMKMKHASQAIDEATSRVKQMVSSSDIMMAADSEAQKKALEERAAKLREVVLQATNSSNAELAAKIDKVTGEANDMIQKILKDESLTEEQQKAMIDKIDAATQASLRDMAMEQAQLDSAMGTYVGNTVDAGRALQDQLGEFENVLKGSQMAWLRSVVEDKQRLEQQVQLLSARVDQISQAVEAAAAENEKDVGGMSEERLEAVRRLRKQMGHMADQRAEMAQAAVQVSKFAQAEASGTATQEELDELRPRVQEIYDRVEQSGEQLWKDLEVIQKEQSTSNTRQFVKDLLRKIEDVGAQVGQAAVAVWKGQQWLSEKLDVTKAMVDRIAVELPRPPAFVELRSAAADLKHLAASARSLDDRVQAGLDHAQAADSDDARALRALLARASAWRPADPEAAVAALERRLSEDEAA